METITHALAAFAEGFTDLADDENDKEQKKEYEDGAKSVGKVFDKISEFLEMVSLEPKVSEVRCYPVIQTNDTR